MNYSLRKYAGVEPSIWDESDPTCEHLWGDERVVTKGGSGQNKGLDNGAAYRQARDVDAQTVHTGQSCVKCGAMLCCLGLEPDVESYIRHLVEVFRLVRRVLRRDGLLFVNIGSSFSSQGGPEIRQSKHPNGASDQVGGARSRRPTGFPPKCDLLIPDRLRVALVADGWIVRVRAAPWIKRSTMPSSAKDRLTIGTEDWVMLSKTGDYYWDELAVRRESTPDMQWRAAQGHTRGGTMDSRDVSRHDRDSLVRQSRIEGNGRQMRSTDPYFDSLDLLIADYRSTLAHLERVRERGGLLLDGEGLPLALDVTSQGSDLAHYAAFAEKVVEPWILGGTSEVGVCKSCQAPWERVTEQKVRGRTFPGAGLNWDERKATGRGGSGGYVELTTLSWHRTCRCPTDERIGATVLDPFAGTSTVGVVAKKLGRRAVMIEASPIYAAMSAKRLATTDVPLPLGATEPPPTVEQLALIEED